MTHPTPKALSLSLAALLLWPWSALAQAPPAERPQDKLAPDKRAAAPSEPQDSPPPDSPPQDARQAPRADALPSVALTASPSQVMCADQPEGPKRQLCQELCRAWPADQRCMVAMRFGAPGVVFVQTHKPGMPLRGKDQKPATLEQLAVQSGFEPQEARRLRWFLTLHLGYRDLNDPTVTKKLVAPADQQRVVQSISRKGTTIKDTRAILEETITLAEQVYGPEDITLQRILQAAFQYAVLDGDIKRAMELITRSHMIAQRHLPEDHPNRAEIELRLGEFLLTVGQREQGLELLRSGHARHDALYQGLHPQGLLATTKLAKAYIQQGSPQHAKPLLTLVAKRQIALFGPRSPQVAQAYTELGSLYAMLNDTIQARLAFGHALTILEALKQDKTLAAYRIHAELGRMELTQARAQRAQAQRHLERGQPEQAALAQEQAQESIAVATVLLQQAIKLFEAAPELDKGSPLNAGLMHELARLYELSQDHDQALAMHQAAFDLRRKAYGLTHPSTLASMHAITHQLSVMGKLELALESSLKALTILEQSNNQAPALLANAHEQITTLAWRTGDRAKARHHQRLALAARQRSLDPKANMTLDQTELTLRLTRARQTFDLAISLALHDQEDASSLWGAALAWQGIITRAGMMRHQERRLRDALPDALRADYAQWRADALGPRGQADPDLTAKLSAQLPAFKALLQSEPAPEPEALCAALKARKRDLLSYHVVQQFDVKARDLTSQITYHAFLVRAQDCKVTHLALGSRDAVDALFTTYRDAIERAERCYQHKGQATLCARELAQIDAHSQTLRAAIWDPIAAAKGPDAEQPLMVVPDGRLVEVNLDGLADAQGRYLIERHAMTTLPFALALLIAPERLDGQGYFLAGDIHYGQSAEPMSALRSWRSCERGRCQMVIGTPFKAITEAHLRAPASLRAPDRSSLCGQQITWAPIQTEVPQVAAMLGKAQREQVTLATGDAVLEPLVRLAIPNRRVVHLATHGFHAQDPACTSYAMTQALMPPATPERQADATRHPREDALELAGQLLLSEQPILDVARLTATVLAGVNRGYDAPADQDGLLDGAEVASLDLGATELVVLSACETGRGVMVEGEGVLGLTQGYILAGAHSLIASLWKIPSQPTSALFEDMYAAMLRKKDPLAPDEALRHAKLKAITRARAQNMPHSSFLWAAFTPILARARR